MSVKLDNCAKEFANMSGKLDTCAREGGNMSGKLDACAREGANMSAKLDNCAREGGNMSVKLEQLQRKVLDWCWKVLKRRLPPGHALFEEGNLYCQLSAKYLPLDLVEEMTTTSVREEFPCGFAKCYQVFDSLMKYESHYNMVHRNVCQTCGRVFPSTHLLDVHVLETHDSMFTLLADKQNMYRCLLEDCDVKLKSSDERRNHMIKQHRFPANYRYDKNKGNRSNKSKPKKIVKDSNAMETEVSVDNTSGTEPGQTSGRVFSYKVPKNISFGQGAPRGFQSRGRGGRGGRGRGKNWHNRDQGSVDTAVNIEEVDMGDLAEALT